MDEILPVAGRPLRPSILSVGCGPGAVLCHVAEATAGDGLGVDVSADALASQAVVDRGLEAWVGLRQGEHLKLEWAGERFDLAMSWAPARPLAPRPTICASGWVAADMPSWSHLSQ